jgi:hypothetical protein
MTPSQVGERAEAAVMAALAHSGKRVYIPIGASGRCDLVFEDDAGLHRVQVKNGVLRDSIVCFRTASNTKNIPKDYRGDIDFFGVYCHDLESTFLVPVGVVPLRAGYLRVRPTRNGQAQNIRWAEQYRLDWSPPGLTADCTVEADPPPA